MSKNIKFYIGVKALILNEKNEMLLLRAAPSETKFENEKVEFWDFPGGRIQEGEGLENALRKEAREEIGATDLAIEGIFHAVISNFMIKDSQTEQTPLALIVYKCRTNIKKIILSHEHSEYKWFSSKEAKKVLLTKYPKEFVEKLNTLK